MEKKITLSGPKVKTIRMTLKPRITQEEVADKINVSRITYVGWEKSAEFKVSLHQAEKLAKIFKTSLSDIQNEPENVVKEPEETKYEAKSIDNFERYDQIYKSLILQKDQALEDKNQEIQRLLNQNTWFQQLVDKLTQGLGSQKVK
jgi:DNA-binding XRE family transcriptional regulator